MSWVGIYIGGFIDFNSTKEEVDWERRSAISGDEGGKLLEFENGAGSFAY